MSTTMSGSDLRRMTTGFDASEQWGDAVSISASQSEEWLRAVNDDENWLFQSPEALRLVNAGLAQARKGQFAANPPDLDSDKAFADSLEG